MAKLTTVSLDKYDKALRKKIKKNLKGLTSKSSLSKTMNQHRKMLGLPTKPKTKKKNKFGF